MGCWKFLEIDQKNISVPLEKKYNIVMYTGSKPGNRDIHAKISGKKTGNDHPEVSAKMKKIKV